MTAVTHIPAWRQKPWLWLLLLTVCGADVWADNHRAIHGEQFLIDQYLPALAAYARQPEIIAALKQQSSPTFSLQQTLQQDKNWPHDTALRQGIAAHPLSTTFKSLVNDEQNTIREVLLIDRYGRLVASYPEASDYYQGDEEKYIHPASKRTYFIDRVNWDDSSGSVAIQIAMPVFDQQEFIGVLVESLEVDLRILTRMQVE